MQRKHVPGPDITRRKFCETTAALGAALLHPGAWLAVAGSSPKPTEPPGTWPVPRQNRCLTSIQPFAGRMSVAPKIAAEIAFACGQGTLSSFASKPGGIVDRAIVAGNGGLRCYRLDGSRLWEAHPPGLNFESLVAAEDLDSDGRVELALTAGRPTQPFGAAVLLDAETGKVLFQYDVEPMSYWWTMKVDRFLPEGIGKQILVCEHGYPPDAKFGYLAMLAFEKLGEKPRPQWRYDFDHYTCFPSLLTADVDGDGVNEICVETHSRMWVLDARTGKVKQFLSWDVSPANLRSYGLVRFQDLNGDGLPEFLCIANFSQHHEVLLNEKGRLKLAWTHGWDTSVTTQTIATTWPDPPVADVDGDGKLELVVNVYACEKEPRWMLRIYDALTGVLKASALDRVATYLSDVDGDGAAELLADISRDPTLTNIEGACLLKSRGNACQELWKQDGLRSSPVLPLKRTDAAIKLPGSIFIENQSGTQRLSWEAGQGVVLNEISPSNTRALTSRTARTARLSPSLPGEERAGLPAAALAKAGERRRFSSKSVDLLPEVRGKGSPIRPAAAPNFSRIPSTIGPVLNAPLVADVDGDGRNEVVHWHQGQVTLYRYARHNGFVKLSTHTSAAAPALADLDGDGKLEMVIGEAGPTTDALIHALRPGRKPETLWKVTLKPHGSEGLPHGPPLAFQTGRFLGRAGFDLYVYVGTPRMCSVVLDGTDGRLVWEKAKIPGLERYYGPTVNLSSVWDVNGDGKDDLVFTCPDYYCVASGPTGEPLVGPAFPPNIFKQPSQGLYTAPAILPARQGEPTVCLVDGHYFVAAMTAHAAPLWHHLPVVGEARASAEGFLQTREGQWLIGFGRQDGQFVCLDVASGNTRWEFALMSTASAVAACDINGDGQQEFIFGTTHGDLYALADAGDRARAVWQARLPASIGTLVIADVDNDGASEILASLGDGRLCLLRAPK